MDVAEGFGGLDAFEHEFMDGREAEVVGGDEGLGGGEGDAFDASGESLGADAVDDAEVDDFGLCALLFGDFVEGDVEDFGGDGSVDVFVVLEGAEECGFEGVVGEDAEFDLGVVGGKEEVVLGVGGDESGADAGALVGSDGDILEVWIGAGESSGGGAGLVEGGVDAAGLGIDEVVEAVEVGVDEFDEGAVFEDETGDFMFGGEFFEDFDVGGGAGLIAFDDA